MRLITARYAKLGSNLKELRIHLCQTCENSAGARDFVQKFYPQLKKDNPELPILIRECAGTQPRLWARFAMGIEKSVSLTKQGAEDIYKTLESTAK